MNTSYPTLVACALALISSCPSQKPAGPAKQRPPLVLAPGAVDVRSVIRQVGKYLGRDYEIEKLKDLPATVASGLTLRLQNPVELDAGSAEAVLSEIAAARALHLVAGKTSHRWVFAHGPSNNLIVANPRVLTPEQVLDSSTPEICVRTTMKVKGDATKMGQQLRPWFASRTSTLRLVLPVADTIEFTGLRHEVVAALQLIRTLEGVALGPADDTPAVRALVAKVSGKASRGFTIERGTHALSWALDKMADLHGTNHLYHEQALAGVSFELKEPLEIQSTNAIRVVSQLAAKQGVMMFPIAAHHGIYEWARVRGAWRNALADRTLFVSVECARQLEAVHVNMITVYRSEKVDVRNAMGILRPQMARLRVTFGSAGPSTLLMQGSAANIVKAVDILEGK
ncbi:MAG: hypothetical protein VB934_10365 [Polyangiaceae bacterium]